MKIRFKTQQFQIDAVNAVVDCFEGQGNSTGRQYRVDPGVQASAGPLLESQPLEEALGFSNTALQISEVSLLSNVRNVQRHQNLPLSEALIGEPQSNCRINLDIEMETGTGKTYCYIRTMFELNKRYGWSKFIVVVPSIAIREGVYKSFDLMRDHFLAEFGKQVKPFIYNSSKLQDLQAYSTDAGINVMIINTQAFASKGKENLRIYGSPRTRPDGTTEMVGLDDFQSRKPIDVIRANRPILILDEPQKMGGEAVMRSLADFNPLFTLRYSATHKKQYNKIYRLDALDAYNQKLVKKIAVRGVAVKGLKGNAYLYLDGIQVSSSNPPVASAEIEVKGAAGIRRQTRKIKKGDDLNVLSNGLDAYDRFVVSDIDARTNTVTFLNGVELAVGEVLNDPDERALRQIQIREAIKAHFEKEKMLFDRRVKVLTLFFIDEVGKYRVYQGENVLKGEYAQIFEEEYARIREEHRTLLDAEYSAYVDRIEPDRTHNGYFAIDKKSKRLVDPKVIGRGDEKGNSDDADAYDLILKDKERLLSFEEPTRFIFSHSALREGWDNPNVFVICMLKHSDNTISRRQEVGRGMRLAVDQSGDRLDDPATIHDYNVLTVVTSESYTEFVTNLQREIKDSLSSRPTKATKEYFIGKILVTPDGDVTVDQDMAHHIYKYLMSNDYVDTHDHITPAYAAAKETETLVNLPLMLSPYKDEVFKLIDGVLDPSRINVPSDASAARNQRNANFQKKEFQELWSKINRKAAYTVSFDSDELIEKAIAWLDKYLTVDKLQFTIQRGSQTESATVEQLIAGTAFKVDEIVTASDTGSFKTTVKYDLVGKVADGTGLTRRTVARILSGINRVKFDLYRINPEAFIANASLLINEQKATVIIQHLSYNAIEERFDSSIFTESQVVENWNAAGSPLKRHIYDYAVTDSKVERKFVTDLDTAEDVVVYAKLPKSFQIPTPVGNYTPDWAVSFKEGAVKHVYFIAETKGSMSSMQLKLIEQSKIECARRFFDRLQSENVKYDVVDSFAKLMQVVN